MLEEYIKNKLLFLSANVVNHPLLSYVHARMRAIMPFYEISQNDWIKYENITEIEETPSKNNTYDAWGSWLYCDKCAAMAHHSFFYDFKIWDFHSNFYTRWTINLKLMKNTTLLDRYENFSKKYFQIKI